MIRPTRTPMVKAGLLFNYAFVLQGWTGNLGVGWNTPAWTLSCEFFFYLFFPLLFVLLRDASRRSLAFILPAAIIVPVLLSHAGVPWTWLPLHGISRALSPVQLLRARSLSNRLTCGSGAGWPTESLLRPRHVRCGRSGRLPALRRRLPAW